MWIGTSGNDLTRNGRMQCDFKYQHIYQMQSCTAELVPNPDDLKLDWLESMLGGYPTFPNIKLSELPPEKQLYVDNTKRNIRVKVNLDVPIRSPCPGQYIVFYNGEECLGSAKIATLGLSMHQKGIDDFSTEEKFELRIAT